MATTTYFERKLRQFGIPNPTASMIGTAGFVISRSAIPVILAPNGTVATNGVVTLGTALPLVYAAAWVRLPAGAVVGGLAGLYYVVFSSTTVGQVYTAFADVATAFTPYVPATLVAAVGSNAAYTQATAADLSLVNFAVPGNSMGANGCLSVKIVESNNNSAGNKNITGKFGGSAFLFADVTTTLAMETEKSVVNRGLVNSQLVHASLAVGAASPTAPTQLTIDTSADVAMVITGKIATATDYVILENCVVRLLAA